MIRALVSARVWFWCGFWWWSSFRCWGWHYHSGLAFGSRPTSVTAALEFRTGAFARSTSITLVSARIYWWGGGCGVAPSICRGGSLPCSSMTASRFSGAIVTVDGSVVSIGLVITGRTGSAFVVAPPAFVLAPLASTASASNAAAPGICSWKGGNDGQDHCTRRKNVVEKHGCVEKWVGGR